MDPEQNNKSKKKTFIIAAIVAVIALTVGIGVIVYSGSPARRLQQQLDLGARYLSELNYEQAIAAYEAALEIDPKNAEAYGGLIDAYGGTGDVDGLMRVYAAAKEQLSESEMATLREKAGVHARDAIGELFTGGEYARAEEAVAELETTEIYDALAAEDREELQNSADEARRMLAEEVDVNTLPESLETFFDAMHWGYRSEGNSIYESMYYRMEYDCRTATGGYSNLMACIVQNPTCAAFSLYPFSSVETDYWGMPGEPPVPDRLKEWRRGDAYEPFAFAEFDKQAVDWIAENIFNLTKEDIDILVRQAEEDRLFYTENNTYIRDIGGVGGPGFIIEIVSAKTHNGRYYLVYDVSDAYEGGGFRARYYAEGEFKEINGQTYWSLYYHSENIPEDMQ